VIKAELIKSEAPTIDLEALKEEIKVEVEDEENQLGLFGSNGKE
jgi:hypothetical protein